MKNTFTKALCVLAVLCIGSIAFAQDDSCCPPPPQQQCDTCSKPACPPPPAPPPAPKCETCKPVCPEPKCDSCCEPCCPPAPPAPCCECRECEICPPCEPCKPCCTEVPKTGEPCNCAYNAPARIDPACGWDAWLSGTFLYWQAKEKGLDLGKYQYVDETTPPLVKHVMDIEMEFDYHPAFKLGVGMSFCRDDWTVYLEYTRFNATDCKTKDITQFFSDSSEFITSIWFQDTTNGDHLSYIKGKWTLDYNLFDLVLGRPYYLGKKLIFKPFYGLRGGWIDQHYKLDGVFYSARNFLDGYSRNDQDTWLVGPRAGLNTDWLVSCDFRIFGNVAGSLTYQNFEVTNKFIIPSQPNFTSAQIVLKTDEFSQITPNVEFSLGLGYGSYFCNNQWYFDLTIGYDFNYFWNQNWMRHVEDSHIYLADGDAGNLMLHGLNVTARVDF